MYMRLGLARPSCIFNHCTEYIPIPHAKRSHDSLSVKSPPPPPKSIENDDALPSCSEHIRIVVHSPQVALVCSLGVFRFASARYTPHVTVVEVAVRGRISLHPMFSCHSSILQAYTPLKILMYLVCFKIVRPH